jgi:hypothetical protein
VLPLDQFQKKYGGEKGTVFSHIMPSMEVVVAEAKLMLGM